MHFACKVDVGMGMTSHASTSRVLSVPAQQQGRGDKKLHSIGNGPPHACFPSLMRKRGELPHSNSHPGSPRIHCPGLAVRLGLGMLHHMCLHTHVCCTAFVCVYSCTCAVTPTLTVHVMYSVYTCDSDVSDAIRNGADAGTTLRSCQRAS
eukprot:352983-Chlamydomonas_euryale.AAC.4